MEDELSSFLSHWFAGYMEGLISLDAEQQDILLAACGKACANSYTGDLYRNAWAESGGDIPLFLEYLSAVFPEAEYKMMDGNKIQVKYRQCACDLVCRGLVENPMQCLCSLHNLKANFKAAMDIEPHVQLQQSILAGDSQCQFEISWSLI